MAVGVEPDRAPVGDAGHEELRREGGHHVLVELPGEQVGRLGEEGERAVVDPVGVGGAVARAPWGGGEDLGDAQVAQERLVAGGGRGPERRLAAGREGQPEPDGLAGAVVRRAPGFGALGDQAQSVAGGRQFVVDVAGRPGPQHAGGVVVRDLDAQGGQLTGAVPRVERAAQFDGGARVHHRVGHQLAHQQDGVPGEPVGDGVRTGEGEGGPFGDRGPYELAARQGREGVAGQARTGRRRDAGGRVRADGLVRAGGTRSGRARTGPAAVGFVRHGLLRHGLVRYRRYGLDLAESSRLAVSGNSA